MNELIKSEAEKYASLEDYPNNHWLRVGFKDGFNRCLELAKMDNEEEFEYYWNNEPSDLFNGELERDHKITFLAAARLKDVEIMELKNKLTSLNDQQMWINIKLEEKLKVAVNAMKSAVGFEPFDSLEPRPLSAALEKIKEK